MVATELAWIAEDLRPLARPTADLNGDPRNARKHNKKNLSALEASLKKFGQRKPVVVRREGMIVEAGNGTLECAKRLGWTHVACVVVDDDDTSATGYALADNRTAELAEWDYEQLEELLLELREEDEDVIGWSERDLEALLGDLGSTPEGEDPGAGEVPVEPVSKPGVIYHLGPHKLLCGSSTDAEAVARLMAGEKARLMATDPPYLVDYDGTNHREPSAERCDEREGREHGALARLQGSALGDAVPRLHQNRAPASG